MHEQLTQAVINNSRQLWISISNLDIFRQYYSPVTLIRISRKGNQVWMGHLWYNTRVDDQLFVGPGHIVAIVDPTTGVVLDLSIQVTGFEAVCD